MDEMQKPCVEVGRFRLSRKAAVLRSNSGLPVVVPSDSLGPGVSNDRTAVLRGWQDWNR